MTQLLELLEYLKQNYKKKIEIKKCNLKKMLNTHIKLKIYILEKYWLT